MPDDERNDIDGFYWALVVAAYALMALGMCLGRFVEGPVVFIGLAGVAAACYRVEGFMKLTIWIGVLVALVTSVIVLLDSLTHYSTDVRSDTFWDQMVNHATVASAAALLVTLPRGLPKFGRKNNPAVPPDQP